MVVAHTCEVGVTLAPFISLSRIYVWYTTDLGQIRKIFKCCFVESKITWQLYIVFFLGWKLMDLCARGLDNIK